MLKLLRMATPQLPHAGSTFAVPENLYWTKALDSQTFSSSSIAAAMVTAAE